MHIFFIVMMLLSMVAVLISLGAGLLIMTRSDMKNKRLAQKIMRARVLAQGSAVFFFACSLLSI